MLISHTSCLSPIIYEYIMLVSNYLELHHDHLIQLIYGNARHTMHHTIPVFCHAYGHKILMSHHTSEQSYLKSHPLSTPQLKVSLINQLCFYFGSTMYLFVCLFYACVVPVRLKKYVLKLLSLLSRLQVKSVVAIGYHYQQI